MAWLLNVVLDPCDAVAAAADWRAPGGGHGNKFKLLDITEE